MILFFFFFFPLAPFTHKDVPFLLLYSQNIRLITSPNRNSLVLQCLILNFIISSSHAKHSDNSAGKEIIKCSHYCLQSKFWYESLEHHSLISVIKKKKNLCKAKALTEVLSSPVSQSRLPCLLQNFSHHKNQICHPEKKFTCKILRENLPSTVTI